jgi:hypothetical protein
MKKPIIFLGPSLPVDVAKTILDADYRPPVRREDVAKAAREKPPLIGIIDGVFMHTLAPSPHEVLRALQAGVPMMGSSSLGALRAVELGPFGMIGVGQVFEWFRSRHLDADDEVAIVFDGETLRAISEPMVNIRYALAAAVQCAICTAADEDVLLRKGKALYFPDRTWRRVFLEAAGEVPAETLARLAEFVKSSEYDLKGLDAKLLLREASRFLEGARPNAVAAT